MSNRFLIILSFFILAITTGCALLNQTTSKEEKLFLPDHKNIRYTGRIDFSDPSLPRFYQPGIYLEAIFEGKACRIIVRDQQLWGQNQNYLQVVVDGESRRIQTRGAIDTIEVARDLPDGPHSLLVCKDTEANIGWLEFGGIICEKLLSLPPPQQRKIEFIGNSITCGASADLSGIPCGGGKWHDQHNAYLSYGPVTARALKADWHLSSVSGIGLIHSCCNLDVLMPRVYDKIDMRGDSLAWNFKNYQPDVVTICLGQNDGIQDSDAFCNAYITFIEKIRSYYPTARIICLNSPMADENLKADMKKNLSRVVKTIHDKGDLKVDHFFFSGQFNGGCDYHPDIKEHAQIAEALSSFLKAKMNW